MKTDNLAAYQNHIWGQDSIQFARLVAEINATGLTRNQWKSLLESMDLNDDELDELFDRADRAWHQIKYGITSQYPGDTDESQRSHQD